VSSSSGGGSADHGHPADGPHNGDGHPAGHDAARLTPPADPWLTEAPTSAFDPAGAAAEPAPDAVADTAVDPALYPAADPAHEADSAPVAAGQPGPVPAAGPVPLPGTAQFAGAAPIEYPSAEDRRSRRAVRWVVAVLAAAALFIGGMLAIDQFGSGAGDDGRAALGSGPSTGTSSTPEPVPTSVRSTVPAVAPVGSPSSEPSNTATASQSASQPAGPVVIYEVTASGSANTGSVAYTDQDGDIIRRNGIDLPWRVTFRLGTQRKPPLVLISQRTGGGDAGPVTCTITLDGKVLSSTTAEGRYAAPQCSG
jgi:hypothetical protein